jgi:hypothetical protein
VEGGEGHGPRKEFFHLIGENWSKADTGQVMSNLICTGLRYDVCVTVCEAVQLFIV